MKTTAEQEYVLGTDADELERLGFQNRVWSSSATALWERCGFQPGMTLLDVGCGPGFTAFDLAEVVGHTGQVVAVDISERFIQHLKTIGRQTGVTHIQAQVADVQKLSLSPQSVDGAYTRWVLCFVPDPEAVIAGVAKALKPGGKFAIQEYYSYVGARFSPPMAILEKAFQATDASWRRSGGDPDVGLRLPSMLVKHGLNPIEVQPLLRVARPGELLWHWPGKFFKNYVPKLVQMGLMTEKEQSEFFEAWEKISRDPSVYFTTPPMVEIVAQKTE